MRKGVNPQTCHAKGIFFTAHQHFQYSSTVVLLILHKHLILYGKKKTKPEKSSTILTQTPLRSTQRGFHRKIKASPAWQTLLFSKAKESIVHSAYEVGQRAGERGSCQAFLSISTVYCMAACPGQCRTFQLPPRGRRRRPGDNKC